MATAKKLYIFVMEMGVFEQFEIGILILHLLVPILAENRVFLALLSEE